MYIGVYSSNHDRVMISLVKTSVAIFPILITGLITLSNRFVGINCARRLGQFHSNETSNAACFDFQL